MEQTEITEHTDKPSMVSVFPLFRYYCLFRHLSVCLQISTLWSQLRMRGSKQLGQTIQFAGAVAQLFGLYARLVQHTQQ